MDTVGSASQNMVSNLASKMGCSIAEETIINNGYENSNEKPRMTSSK